MSKSLDGHEISARLQKDPRWIEVLDIVHGLSSAGHKAWLAGGCVRDAILARTPKDFDIASSASPEQVEAIFPNAVDVGRAFGVMVIPTASGQIEVASFRTDGEYKDGRRPEKITLSTPEEDARRRDFTMNALFFDIEAKELHDFVGGVADINSKLIRTVGAPDSRFNEDHLRILRAVRFSAELEFSIEPKTQAALTKWSESLKTVSRERIYQELVKLIQAEGLRTAFGILRSTDMLSLAVSGMSAENWNLLLSDQIADEIVAAQKSLNPLQAEASHIDSQAALQSQGAQSLAGRSNGFKRSQPGSPEKGLSKQQYLRNLWSLWLSPLPVATRDFFLAEFKFPNDDKRYILGAQLSLETISKADEIRLGEVYLQFMKPWGEYLVDMFDIYQTILAQPDSVHEIMAETSRGLDAQASRIQAIERIAEQFKKLGYKFGEKPKNDIDGAYLTRRGMKPGAAMGQVIQNLYLDQIEGKFKNIAEAEAAAAIYIKNKTTS
jgi:tRNA nucleotidyltransferase/poly(A) polymerase